MMQRVLSIQSHVVSGYVGNRSAVFPLQVLGFEVDFINSVQFSNHTGYKAFKGQTLDADELGTLMQGLRLNGINRYSHLLTGYIGSKSFLMKIVDVVKELKEVNPDMIYVLDPVMGDNGQMYVPENLLPVYQEHVIPLADVIVPNQYEAELLTGRKINNETEAIEAMDWLHGRGIRTVVLSSTSLTDDGTLLAIASTRQADGSKVCFKIKFPRFPVNYTGSGDLFAALLLAWLSKSKGDMKSSLENTIATMQAVLQRTMDAAQGLAGSGNKPTVEHLELKLVQSISDIQSPHVQIQAMES